MLSTRFVALSLLHHGIVAECVRRHTIESVAEVDLSGRHCPAGLQKVHVELNGTALKKCVYEGEPVPPLTWGATHEFSDFWDTSGSGTQLYFEAEKQYLNVQAFFLDEMAVAAKSKKILAEVAADVQKDLRQKQVEADEAGVVDEAGVGDVFKHDDEHHDHTLMENITHGAHDAHELVENFQPVEKVAMHPVEHAVLHEMAYGLEALEHSAHAAHFAGAEVVEGGLEVLLFGVEASVTPWALIPITLYTAYSMNQHYKRVGKHAELFASSLVLKADCMIEKITMGPKEASEIFSHRDGRNFFRAEVRAVCRHGTREKMMMQIQRTNFAMRRLFDAIRSLGMCLHQPQGYSWDELKLRWVSKQNCAEAVYEPLRMHEGMPGLLSNALALAATYGTLTDELLNEPGLYQDWFMKELGVTQPKHEHIKSVIEHLVSIDLTDLKARTLSCVSILATHRAFERVFLRLSTALPVFMQTYARDFKYLDIRLGAGAYIHPCRRVIQNVQHEPTSGLHFCKQLMPFNETSACSQGHTTPSLWPEASPVHCAATKQFYDMGQHPGLKDSYSISTALGLAHRLNMPGTGETEEFSASLCQARCKRQVGCAYFTWFPKGQCYLANENATLKKIHDYEGMRLWHTKTMAGPRDCPEKSSSDAPKPEMGAPSPTSSDSKPPSD